MDKPNVIVIFLCVVILRPLLRESRAVIVLRWSATKSTLEARYNDGKWGEVCAQYTKPTQFNDKAANVSCRQMGFLNGNVHPTEVQAKRLAIVLEEVVCPTGKESSLSKCKVKPATASSKCPRTFPIRVECTTNPALDGLFNAGLGDKSIKAHEGILHVTKDGKEGDVCYDATTAGAVAKVVCKQMGYSYLINQTPLKTSSSTSFYTANCPKGTEETLAACTISAAATCSTGTVINVQCKLDKATQRHFDIRLSSPNNSESEGTVEVYQYGRWGVVCDTNWDIKDAEVVCRELGYKSANSKETDAKFGQGGGVVFWNKMQCNSKEPSIANCTKDVALGTKTCDSANATGVVCNTEKFSTIDICSNGPKVLEAGVTMIQSVAQPKPFTYTGGQTCFLNLTSPTNFTVYIYKKMFEENHVEYMSFISANRNETLYGDDSRQGPFDFNSGGLTIEFNADTASGTGVINMMVSVAALPPTTSAAMTTTTNVAAPSPTTPAAMTTTTNGNEFTSTPEHIRDDGGTTNAGIIIGGAVVGSLALVAAVLGIVNCSLYKIKKKSSVGSFENNVDDEEGGVENTSFTPDLFAANPQGNGVIPGNGVAKEPETGETEQKTKLIRPASDSGINAYELEKLPNEGVPIDHAPSHYELEGAPTNQACSPYEFEGPTLGADEPVTKGVGPQHFTVSGPGNQEYAMVNKPRMGRLPPLSPKGAVGNQEYAIVNKSRKGLPPLAPKFTVGDQEYAVVNKPKNNTVEIPLSGPNVPPKHLLAGPTVPPKNLDGLRSPYVPGGNLVKDQSTEPPVTGVPGYNPYQDVEEDLNPPFNKPNTFMPVSAAYADVELGAPGEASKIQDQPKQKEPTKKEKKKKHGKDKKKPEKEKKKIARVGTGLIANGELEELPKGGVLTIHNHSPYELEGAPTTHASNPYELESPTLGSEEPVTKGVGPQHFTVSGPGNQEYAIVNKPMRMGRLPPMSPKGAVGNQEYAMVNKSRKGLPPLAPKYTVGDQEYAMVIKTKKDTGGVPLSGPTVPPKNLDGPRSPYVPGGNLVKDQPTEPPVTGVPGYNPYQDVEEDFNPPFNKPNTFMPVSAAYADVELGAPGEPSKIQDQPKQKEPTKKEKKKHGKDEKKPEKEKKKKWRKDKKKSKENLAEDGAHAPEVNESCAVRDDFDIPPECMYAEARARGGVGQINPAGQPELNNSEIYDRLDFKGRKAGPHNPGNEATYDTVRL